VQPDFLIPIFPLPDQKGRAGQERHYRLRRYVAWLHETRRFWTEPDFDAYHDYLIRERRLSEASAKAHLATIRARYRELLQSGVIRQVLAEYIAARRDGTYEALEESLDFLIEAISAQPQRLPSVKSDETEAKVLSVAQAAMLLRRPGLDTLTGLRDTAILALMLGTGLREQEVIELEVHNLYGWSSEEQPPVVYIPNAPGCVERRVPYLHYMVIEIVEKWLGVAEILFGPVFRGFYRGEKVRPTPLSRRALQQVLASYPIEVDGEQVVVRPLDLRRTYARLLYDQGYDFFTIQRYLGVKQANTVASYLAGERQPTWRGLADIFDLPGLREPFSVW